MAAVLRVSSDELEQIARELERIAVESKELNNRTRNIVNKISSSWTGDAMETFSREIIASCHDEERKIELLQQLSKYIRHTLQEYSQAESSIAKSIKEMFKP